MKARSLVVGLLASAAAAAGGLAAPSAIAAESDGVRPFIVGGSDADQEYSFMVSLQDGGEHFCGGSLINAEWVLTAAHCVEGDTPDRVRARIGSNTWQEGGEEAQAAEIIVHPDYDGDSPGGDIALIRLAAPAASASIALDSAADVGTRSTILGWGQTCPELGGCGASDYLQQLDVEVIDPAECTEIDADTELCTSNPDGDKGACYGDSGGPQIVPGDEGWKLIGVTSRPGNGDSQCATGPSIYTSAVAYTDWINENAGGGAAL